MRFALLPLAALVACSSAAFADDETPPVVRGRTYVQHQILSVKALHPEIASITVVGKWPEGKGSLVVIGSTEGAANVFKAAAESRDGSTAAGRYFVVNEPFLSNSAHRLGTIEIRFRNVPANKGRYLKVASDVQARLARNTLSLKNAVDPYPFDPAFGPNTYAQKLTERTVKAHPDLLVMMIHATPPKGAYNVVIGSNIGRFGKKADEDDLRVIEKGSTNLEVGGDNDRFETELPLLDRTGKRIGALGLVFHYKADSDKGAIHRHGLAIRDEVARAIPNSADLFRPAR